jgi:hypothetical protein
MHTRLSLPAHVDNEPWIPEYWHAKCIDEVGGHNEDKNEALDSTIYHW